MSKSSKKSSLEKQEREARLNVFLDSYFELISLHYDVSPRWKEHQFIIHTGGDKIGSITFFPKGDKIQFHDNEDTRSRSWLKEDGLNFIIRALDLHNL